MNITPKKSNETSDSDGKIDEEFVKAMLEIEKHYSEFNKHDKIRIEQWSKKLCQITQNPVWKQNRNNYALIMLHCVKKGALEEPFTKVPPEDSLPALNSHIVKKRLSSAVKQNKTKQVTSLKSSKAPTEANNSVIYHEVPPSDHKTPYKESVDHSQDLNWSHKIQGFTTPSDTYTSNKKNLKVDVHRFGDEVYVNGSADNKEMMRLKSDLDLARANLERMQSELEIKDLTISQLNKKLITAQNMVKNIEQEKATMADLLNVIKTAIENENLSFTNPAIGNKFVKNFNQHCHEFPLSAIQPPPTTTTANNNNILKSSIKTSPGQPEFKTTTPSHRNPSLVNYDYIGNENKAGYNTMSEFNHSKNISFQKIREDLSFEDPQDFMQRKLQASASSTKSGHSTRSRYDEVKSFLQSTDKSTIDFLATLEKFQKDNEKLKKEAKELLTKS